MKWRVLTLFCVKMYRITQESYSIFLSMTVKSTPVSLVFSVGQNENKFIICLRVKVFMCNIQCGKNHIFQVLEYHRKLKKTM